MLEAHAFFFTYSMVNTILTSPGTVLIIGEYWSYIILCKDTNGAVRPKQVQVRRLCSKGQTCLVVAVI